MYRKGYQGARYLSTYRQTAVADGWRKENDDLAWPTLSLPFSRAKVAVDPGLIYEPLLIR